MLFLLGRRSRSNPNIMRFLTDGSSCGRRSMTPMHFDTEAEAEAHKATRTPGKYFVVPVPTLAVVDGKMDVVAEPVTAFATTKATPRNRTARKRTVKAGVYETYRGRDIRKTANGYRAGNLTAKTRDDIRALIRAAK